MPLDVSHGQRCGSRRQQRDLLKLSPWRHRPKHRYLQMPDGRVGVLHVAMLRAT